MRDYKQRAIRILQAIDRGRVPVDWAKIDEPELVQEIAQELRKMDKDEQEQLDRIAGALEALAGCVSNRNQFCMAADVTGGIDVNNY